MMCSPQDSVPPLTEVNWKEKSGPTKVVDDQDVCETSRTDTGEEQEVPDIYECWYFFFPFD